MKNAWIFCFLATAASAARIAPLPAINVDQLPAGAETRIVPLVRSGVQGQWEFRSGFILNNTSSQPVNYSVEFFCEHGKIKELTFVNNDGKSRASRLSGQLAPYQVLSFNANSKPEKMEELAWARVRSSVPGAITFETISWFNQPNAAEKYFSMAPVPADTRRGSFVFAGGEDLLLVNDSSAAQTVRLTARSEAGKELCRADKTLQPGQLFTESFAKLLTCVDKNSGSIDISAPNGVAMLALRYASGIHPLYPGAAQQGLESSLEDRVKEIFDVIIRPARKEE